MFKSHLSPLEIKEGHYYITEFKKISSLLCSESIEEPDFTIEYKYYRDFYSEESKYHDVIICFINSLGFEIKLFYSKQEKDLRTIYSTVNYRKIIKNAEDLKLFVKYSEGMMLNPVYFLCGPNSLNYNLNFIHKYMMVGIKFKLELMTYWDRFRLLKLHLDMCSFCNEFFEFEIFTGHRPQSVECTLFEIIDNEHEALKNEWGTDAVWCTLKTDLRNVFWKPVCNV